MIAPKKRRIEEAIFINPIYFQSFLLISLSVSGDDKPLK
jgi:hypothetical protein